jgi:AAA ATPase domain
MPSEGNPFTEQIEVEYFVGREELLKQFHNDLNGLKAQHPNHQYVAGLNGTGKTTYLAKLVELAKTGNFLTAMPTLDQQVVARPHVSKIMRELIRELQVRLAGNYLDDWDSGGKSKHFYHPRSEELDSDRLRQDFQTIEKFMKEAGIPGAVICIDEGQRIDGRALSALKNSLQHLRSYLIVLSIRLVTDAGGAVAAGRNWLDVKVSSEAEGDLGASRFYVTGVSLGPFDTDDEAAQCIKRRLDGNIIQFDDDVIARIGRISSRLPKHIISISNTLYNEALKAGKYAVGTALLNQTFRNMYQKQVQEAMILLNNAPATTRSAFKGLLQLRQPATATEIAARLYPTADAEVQAPIADGIQVALEKVSALPSVTFLSKADDHFDVPDPAYVYALELALGMV